MQVIAVDTFLQAFQLLLATNHMRLLFFTYMMLVFLHYKFTATIVNDETYIFIAMYVKVLAMQTNDNLVGYLLAALFQLLLD